MLVPMGVLALACAAVGLAAPLVVRCLAAPLALLPGTGRPLPWDELVRPLAGVSIVAGALLALAAVAALGRRAALAGKEVRSGVTWDCGYVAPTARMQYTAASFAQPITDGFRPLIRSRQHLQGPRGVFPGGVRLHTEPRDPWLHGVFTPLFAAAAWAASRLRWLQQATIQVYILYIAVTVLVLLAWELG
jgi:hypothetical protein